MTSQKKRKTRKQSNSLRFTIRGIRHDPPDLHKLAKVIVSLMAVETLGDESREHGFSPSQAPTPSTKEKYSETRPEAA